MEQKKHWQQPNKGGYQKSYDNSKPQEDTNKPFVAKISEEKEISFDKIWITDKIVMDAVLYADKFGENLVKSQLTTSQLRNFFGEVRRIQMQTEFNSTDFFLLKPKLAYAARRAKGNGVKILKNVLDLAHDAVLENGEEKIKENFDRFATFLEAILAYHKGHGGKDTSR